MNLSVLLKDPFRFFFPLGSLAGAIGVGLWLPMAWGNNSYYPAQTHRLMMTGGFLLAFATGFLTTAIPRFTSTDYLTGLEFLVLSTTQMFAIVCALTMQLSSHYSFVFLTISALIFFAVRRFLKRNANPPFTFVFIGAGLVLWEMASLVLTVNHSRLLETIFVSQANPIYTHGALLFLVIGVGGRLIPGLLGWEDIVMEQRSRYENADAYEWEIPGTLWLALLVLLASYVLEGYVRAQIIWLLRASVVSYIAVQYWRLYKFPSVRTGFTWGIWAACWSLLLGSLVPVVWPAGGVHGVHMIFIGGFSLLTILVATRVTLAHGTEGKQLESSSRILKILVVIFIVAMLTRMTVTIWPRVYFTHLGYAALLWVVGIALWGMILLPRMLTDFEPPKRDS